ncbi:MAG: HEAT repeat domain-containing protein, partial [Planctomycetia bacterium]|nr:HEAT repeat domain-containing protein [Planctomycetia bacterium]
APAAESLDKRLQKGTGVAALPLAICSDEDQKTWRMFVHYFRLARFDLAADEGAKVLAVNLKPIVMLALAESRSTGYDTLVKMQTVKEMGDVPAKILKLVDEGMRQKRTDPERINKNLMRLANGPRAYHLGLKELKYSGPYVVSHALVILQDPANKEKIWPEVIRALSQIGRPVVLPLVYALATESEGLKQTICDILGSIRYSYSLPALKAIMEDKTLSGVTHTAARDAMQRISGDPKILETPAKVLYLDLARRYYEGKISGISDSRSATTDVFGWVNKGLTYKAVPTSIVGEVLSARACVDALRADPRALDAVTLWVSAQLQMKAKLPDKPVRESNPFAPKDMPDVEFFALAVGQQYLYEVLADAMKSENADVALQAIYALEKVSDEKYLRSYGQSGLVSPLAEALRYPDRRIRFAAAFAMAEVRPVEKFLGSEDVVPVLAEALNLQTGKAVLIAEPDSDNRNRIKSALEKAGYRVVGAVSGKEAIEQSEDMPRLDAVIVSSRTRKVNHGEVIHILRANPNTEITPVIVLSWPDDPIRGSELKAKYKYVEVIEADTQTEGIEKAIADLAKAVGSITFEAEKSAAYSLRAAKELKRIASSKSAYNARDARQVLLNSLSNRPEDLIIAAIEALAEIADPEITRAIAKVATHADTPLEVRLAALGSLTRAIRFAGNHLKAVTIEKLRTMTEEKDTKLRNAVATVLGALNLPPAEGAKILLKYGT